MSDEKLYVPCFDFRNISKFYGSKCVLDDITITIPVGANFCFIGKNGSGKTTALKLCANLLLPDKGKMYFKGRCIGNDDISMQSRIGAFINPERSLYWRLTGWENVERTIFLKDGDYNEKIKQAKDLFLLFDLEKDKKKLVGLYSKGMKAKLLLINALIGDPDVLLLDEPFEGLDLPTRRKVIDILKILNKRGKTIIMTAHNLVEMQNFTSDVCWFDQGKVAFMGSPEKLIATIPGQGVIEIYSQRLELFEAIVSGMGSKIISCDKEEDVLRILTHDLTGTFNDFKKNIDSAYERLELHVKGIEDVYTFYKK